MAPNHNKTAANSLENVKAANEQESKHLHSSFKFGQWDHHMERKESFVASSEDKYLPVYNMSANGTPGIMRVRGTTHGHGEWFAGALGYERESLIRKTKS